MVKLALDDRALGSSVNPDGSAGNLRHQKKDICRMAEKHKGLSN